MDRVGSCDFTFAAEEKKLRHKVPFNTTEPKKTSWLDGMFIMINKFLATIKHAFYNNLIGT